jgi:thiol-disulfide isomerase/thioredoxin/outer membrane lipoprotein-sorting protein
MRHRIFVPAALILLRAAVAVSQPAPATAPSGALELLERVAQHYADAKSYYIESTEEINLSSQYDRDWQKAILVAAEAPGGQFYFEGRGHVGSAIKVSDGKTVWKYHVEEGRYTAGPATDAPSPTGPVPMAEMTLMNAQSAKQRLADLAKDLKSADLLPETTLDVAGQPVICAVIRVRNVDFKRANPNYSVENTIWIDKQHEIVVKTEERAGGQLMFNVRTREDRDAVTSYNKTVLDGPIPASLFKFEAPAGAVLIGDFPDPRESFGPSMTGEIVPALKFKSADGKAVAIESFRGKPVLLDFWATWCAPCVASTPMLAEIYKEGKDKGLVMISVDQDQEATKASDFLSKKGYDWPNFHDGDGEIEKLMGSGGIPRTVLVDAKGQIVYDGTGMDENHLRTHLAQLGPEFRDLTPKPQPAPCVAAK